MSEVALTQQYVLAFGAPMLVLQMYGRAKATCFTQHKHHLDPGCALQVVATAPFAFEPDTERQFFLHIDQMVRRNQLTALEVNLGAIGRFLEPEDVIYLEVGSPEAKAAVGNLLAHLDSIGTRCSGLDEHALHVPLSRRGESALELQDLTFGVYSDLCACRDRPRKAMLTELVLYDQLTGDAVRSWTLRRH